MLVGLELLAFPAPAPSLQTCRTGTRVPLSTCRTRVPLPACRRFGRLTQCIKHLGKRFAHVEFADAAAAAAALRQMHEREVRARGGDRGGGGGPAHGAAHGAATGAGANRRGGWRGGCTLL